MTLVLRSAGILRFLVFLRAAIEEYQSARNAERFQAE
jgi:hypothetical protein